MTNSVYISNRSILQLEIALLVNNQSEVEDDINALGYCLYKCPLRGNCKLFYSIDSVPSDFITCKKNKSNSFK